MRLANHMIGIDSMLVSSPSDPNILPDQTARNGPYESPYGHTNFSDHDTSKLPVFENQTPQWLDMQTELTSTHLRRSRTTEPRATHAEGYDSPNVEFLYRFYFPGDYAGTCILK